MAMEDYEDLWMFDEWGDVAEDLYLFMNRRRPNRMAIVQGTAEWCSVQEPNTTFEPVYCIDVIVDDDTATALEGQGLTVKRDAVDKDGNARGNVFKVKRKAFRKGGVPNQKPNCVDAKNQPFNDLIGNGSLVNVQYNVFNWEFAGKKGTSADFVGVQVLKHVPMQTNSPEFEAVEEPDTPAAITASEFDEEF